MSQGTRAFIGALALIGMGFSLGVVTDRWWLTGADSIESQDDVRERLVEDLRLTVGLSDEQVAQVHTIFNHYQQVIDSTWGKMHPQLQVALDSAFAQVNSILDPEQVRAFHEWFAETHRRPMAVSR